MVQIEDIFNRIRTAQKEQRSIRAMYKDALTAVAEYNQIVDQIDELKVKRKQIEAEVENDMGADFAKLDELKLEVETDKELLSDEALNKYVKGETVEIIDEYDNKYEPIFSVKFKKTF